MLFRPDTDELRLIGFLTGRVLSGIGLTMAVPAAVAVAVGELNDAAGFLIGGSLAVIAGRAGGLLRTRRQLTAGLGLATITMAWLIVPVFAAVPLALSGHYASYLDAYFEAMSGFAVNGLTLVTDLDHLPRSVNLWRHLMHLLGGQGFIIVVLTVFASVGGRLGALYTGEGEDDLIVPNVAHTARVIRRVTLAYAGVGVALLWVLLLSGGMPGATGLFHAANLFMAAFDTGGFATMSSGVGFYRSPLVEAALLPLMVAGAFSFALHYQLWRGRRGEMVRNIQTRTIAVSVVALFAILAVGLVRNGTFVDLAPLLRHGFFQIVTAHTTSGLSGLPGQMYVTDWGVLAPAMLVSAMAMGGMAGSAAGGIKAIRVGLILKGLRHDIRRMLLPEDAVVVETYHSGRPRILRDDQVLTAATIFLLWLVLYLAGGLVGLFYGYDLQQSLFESTAAASSGGLSIGLVRPELEWPLKLSYIVQMLVGRLEFVAVLALAGYMVALVRGRV